MGLKGLYKQMELSQELYLWQIEDYMNKRGFLWNWCTNEDITFRRVSEHDSNCKEIVYIHFNEDTDRSRTLTIDYITEFSPKNEYWGCDYNGIGEEKYNLEKECLTDRP